MRALFGCCLCMTLLAGAGCASREWVRDVIAEREARIEQKLAGLDQSVAAVAASDEARERVDQAAQAERQRREREHADIIGARLAAIEQAVADARETSRVARDRADQAVARAEAVDARLTRLWGNRHARKAVNSLHIKFGFDDASLDDAGKSALLAIAQELKEHPSLSIDLEGYADPRGSHDYNVRLSRRRVESVQRYLEQLGIESRRISGTARGPVSDPAIPDERKRRVAVKIMLDAD
jgi:outer membrane protein OmpA-like peptidoglycan-associated protein